MFYVLKCQVIFIKTSSLHVLYLKWRVIIIMTSLMFYVIKWWNIIIITSSLHVLYLKITGYLYHDQFASCFRDDPRFTSSQWESSLQSNAVCHWLGASLESALCFFSAPTCLFWGGYCGSNCTNNAALYEYDDCGNGQICCLDGTYHWWYWDPFPLQWRHNMHDSVSNHQPHHCLLNGLFRRDQRKHQRSASLAFVWGIHRRPVNSSHKWPVTRKIFPFDDVIMH